MDVNIDVDVDRYRCRQIQMQIDTDVDVDRYRQMQIDTDIDLDAPKMQTSTQTQIQIQCGVQQIETASEIGEEIEIEFKIGNRQICNEKHGQGLRIGIAIETKVGIQLDLEEEVKEMQGWRQRQTDRQTDRQTEGQIVIRAQLDTPPYVILDSCCKFCGEHIRAGKLELNQDPEAMGRGQSGPISSPNGAINS